MDANEIYGSAILGEIIEKLDLPPGAYEKAEERYRDLGEWFSGGNSLVQRYNPHIFSQGSFRLGTVIRPLDEKEDYDLDLVCKLRNGYNKVDHTQKELKELIGSELEKYRVARGIQKPLEAKHRCWCLEYKDTLGFHMDIVPCIPAEETKVMAIMESIRSSREIDEDLSRDTSRLTVSITDDREQNFDIRDSEWPISNPEGYALWFETRMNKGAEIAILERAKIDNIPMYARKTILQRVVQILKRHRDVFFRQDKVRDRKPASIIISTLAARAYKGEQGLARAISGILADMDSYIFRGADGKTFIPNPVDPKENFADKWSDKPFLETSFTKWLKQVQLDYMSLSSPDQIEVILENASRKFEVNINPANLSKYRALVGKATAIVSGNAFTDSNGTIASAGIKNKSHKFYD